MSDVIRTSNERFYSRNKDVLNRNSPCVVYAECGFPEHAILIAKLLNAHETHEHPTRERLLWLIGQLIGELPQKRDWLNPDIENELRSYQKANDTKEDENVFAFYVDKRRFESPERIVNGNRIRELAAVPARYNVHVENPHSTDDYMGDSQTIDLGGPLYRFFTVPQGFM